MVASSVQRVVRTSSLRKSTMVWKPISGRNSPKASSPDTPASRRARRKSTRRIPAAISHLLDVGAAEQALREEDERDGQHREGGDILVIDGEVSRPHGL